MNKMNVGDAVMCNGYEGTIITVFGGVLAGMVEVKLARGVVCIGISDKGLVKL